MALTEKLTAVAEAIRQMSEKQDKLTLEQMPLEILQLQPLNFKVVGNPRPAAAGEDTIWVDTDAEITGWCFRATEPETPAEGMVWIRTGTESVVEFNALKKNNITVYPLCAKQYESGAWVEKDAKSHQGGQWVDWILLDYIFQNGNGARMGLILTGDKNSTATMDSNQITIVMTTTSYGLFCVTTENPIDLTRYKRLVCELQCSKQHHESAWVAKLTVDATRKVPDKTNDALASATLVADNVRRAYEIDISQMTGAHYIALRGGCSAVVYNWYLEG